MVLEDPCTRNTPRGGRERERERERCDRGLLGGVCSCDTPATPSELQNEPRQGCSYTVERDGGGVASAPLSKFVFGKVLV